MKQIYAILAAILILSVLWYLWSVNVVSHTSSAYLCITGIGEAKDNCFSKIALEQQNEVLCGKIADYGMMNKCYLNVAIIKGNQSLCKKITDDQIGYDCFYKVAIKKQDITLCENLKGWPNSIEEYLRNKCIKEITQLRNSTSEINRTN